MFLEIVLGGKPGGTNAAGLFESKKMKKPLKKKLARHIVRYPACYNHTHNKGYLLYEQTRLVHLEQKERKV